MNKISLAFLSLFSVALSLASLTSLWAQNPNFSHLPSFAPHPDQSFLVYGGSFSPPTKGHLQALVQTMRDHGFQKAVMMVAFPYKPGALPGKVPLHLTRVAVEHLDEILKEMGIPFQKSSSSQPGQFAWEEKVIREENGKTEENIKKYEVLVSDKEIALGKEKMALPALENLFAEAKEKNDSLSPQDVFAVFGADCIVGLPKWTKPESWLNIMNWVVVNRKNPQGTAWTFDMQSPDPLKPVIHPEFYQRFDIHQQDQGHHAYLSTTPNRPGIFLVNDEEIGDVSSTLVRGHLQSPQGAHHPDLPKYLTPTVLQKIQEYQFYTGTDEAKKVLEEFLKLP